MNFALRFPRLWSCFRTGTTVPTASLNARERYWRDFLLRAYHAHDRPQ